MTNEELKEIETLLASDEFFLQESGATVIRDLIKCIAEMRASQEEKSNTYHCMYCLTVGHDPHDMAEHIKTCESHPLTAARKEIEKLKADLLTQQELATISSGEIARLRGLIVWLEKMDEIDLIELRSFYTWKDDAANVEAIEQIVREEGGEK